MDEKGTAEKVLVIYASRAGSTTGVAQAIGETLAAAGVPADVLPMQEVEDLTSYRAVVAGSAIQGGQWLPEAMRFVQTNQAALAEKPFAAFLVCMTMAMKQGAYREQVSAWMAPVRALVRPVSEGLFAGAFDIRKVPSFSDRLKFQISIKIGVWPVGDQRDWNAVRAWAEGLPPRLLR